MNRSAFTTRRAFARVAGILFVIAAAAIAGYLAFRPRSSTATPQSAAFRIVSLSPAIAVTMHDLGLESQIVGRDGYDLILPKSIPACGDIFKGLDYEAIINCRPTHVLLQLGNLAVPERLSTLAAEHHWTIVNYPQLTLDDVQSLAVDLQTRFSPKLSLNDTMTRAWSKRPGIEGAGTVLLLAALDPPSALGPGSFHHQILERIGGTPAITSGSQYITLDAETVLRLKPDGIILILPRSPGAPGSTPTVEDLRKSLGRIGTLDIPACRQGHLALIDDPFAHTPSSAMIGLADRMADILKSWSNDR